jgi:hypothetical protein
MEVLFDLFKLTRTGVVKPSVTGTELMIRARESELELHKRIQSQSYRRLYSFCSSDDR